ncbi:hypothetical protein PR202_gb21458 [Eleusine coracana subsp. coracana]|uniref:Uncharacterized protein n=1 Tax=Eleusine coracana subsp. coracana TaxID=191504 RepID=A0AAV5FDA3_ELECO|nr:hypothetical protein PR202_gb21458 [Eleusine coracana subsp. coracana]
MAASLRRTLPSLGSALLTPTPARMLTSGALDALVEIKPGESGHMEAAPGSHIASRECRCFTSPTKKLLKNKL